jgi:tRNA pseudouridine(55) synthase
MPPFLFVEKRVGQTPLQSLDALRIAEPQYADMPLSYAGRLDPMASGVLLVLVGEECKNREKYLGLDKEYEFEVLFGFTSDTGDVLGMAARTESNSGYSDDQCREAGLSIVGTHELPYPAFSSKTVAGKPLFQYALEGTLSSVDMPTTPMSVRSIEYLGMRTLRCEDMIDEVLQKIQLFNPSVDPERLGSDFRKDAIVERWALLQKEGRDVSCSIAKYRAHVSSGTYIRTLSSTIADALGTRGLAYSINRTRICL